MFIWDGVSTPVETEEIYKRHSEIQHSTEVKPRVMEANRENTYCGSLKLKSNGLSEGLFRGPDDC